MTALDTSHRHRIMVMNVLRWALPIGLGILTVFYEVGPGRQIHDRYGAESYFDLDILFYGLIVPVITYSALTLAGQWIDKMQRAEHQAQASERRLAAILSASIDAILSVDPHGNIDSWNRGAELLLGYSALEAHGRAFSSLFGTSERAEVEANWLSQQVMQAGFLQGHETTCRNARGEDVAIDVSATRLDDASGQSLGISVILRDITDRKHRDDEIRRLNLGLSAQVLARTGQLNDKMQELARANATLQEMDRTRSEFMSLVSHQIRAPLTNMRGAAERMRADCGAINGTCIRMFAILDQQVERLDRLVQGVLNTSRIESGEFDLTLEPVSLLPIVQQAADEIRARTVDRKLQMPIKPGLPLVLADSRAIVEVLINLLDNADKYSPPGTIIQIDVQAEQTTVTVSVRDFGSGFKLTDADRLFEKFYRASGGDAQATYGYGLGLYVCRRLIEAQSGRIWAENVAGGGARFSFSLPVAR